MHEDRHGRAYRTDNDPRRRPSDGFRVRSAVRFRALLEDALDALPDALGAALEDARVEIDDVPPRDGTPVQLAAVELARPGHSGSLVVYRRPLELRARGRDDLGELLRQAVSREVARALGRGDLIEPDDDW